MVITFSNETHFGFWATILLVSFFIKKENEKLFIAHKCVYQYFTTLKTNYFRIFCVYSSTQYSCNIILIHVLILCLHIILLISKLSVCGIIYPILYFGTVPTVWYVLVFILLLTNILNSSSWKLLTWSSIVVWFCIVDKNRKQYNN